MLPSPLTRPSAAAYGVAAGAACLAAGVAFAMHRLEEHAVFPVLHLAVAAAAIAGGWGPAALATLLTGAAALAWFRPPDEAVAPHLLPFLATAVAGTWLWTTLRDALLRWRARESAVSDQLDALLAALPVGVGLVDRELRYVRLNPALAAVHGVAAAQGLGRALREVGPQQAAFLEPLVRQVLATGLPVHELDISAPAAEGDGARRHWRASFVPVGGAPGHPAWVGVKVLDITERIAQTQRMALETERRQFLLDLGDAVARAPGAHSALMLTSASLGRRLDLSHCVVLNHATRPGHVTAASGQHQQRGRPVPDVPVPCPIAAGPPADVIVRRGLLVVGDTRREAVTAHDESGFFEKYGIRAFVALPLLRQGRVVGTFLAADDQPRAWSDDDVRLLRDAAERVWPIYEMADLLEEAQALAESLQRSQAELAVNERRLSLALEVTGTGVWGLNPRTGETHWSRHMNDVTGTAPGWHPQSLGDLRPLFLQPEELGLQLDRLGAPPGLQPVDREFRIVRQDDGRVRWVRLCAEWLLVPDPDSPWLLGTLQDVTERREHEARLAALNAELEERVALRTRELGDSNRALDEANKELEAFSYSVSHDLRAPLRAMDGFSLALLEDYGGQLDDEGRRYLGFIRDGAQLMSQLVNDLLNLSRVSRRPIERSPTDLSGLAAEVLDRLRRAEPGREVAVEIEPGLDAECDGQLVGIALTNLLGNAWKFTGRTPGARITFRRETARGEPVFVVEDNGAGFDMQYASKLFVPFQRLHGTEEFSGTGIGLATVHRVVRRHGGRVWAEGTPGRGATFRFTLGTAAARAA